MAQYPTGVPSFSAKNDGDVVQAAHINDLQNEITAIGDALINGIAHQVTFNSSVTFTSSVSGIVVPRARVYMSTGGTVIAASGVWLGINWDVEDYDSHGMHSTASNSSRVTFADSTGVYHASASMPVQMSSTSVFQSRIVLNDTTGLAGTSFQNASSNTRWNLLNIDCDVHVTSTADYITVQVFSDTSGAASVFSKSTSVLASVMVHKVSR